MKVAIPIFNGRVSPRFDFALKVLVATVEKEEVTGRDTYSLLNLNPIRRNSLLRELGVDVLICGGISDFSIRYLLDLGVEVVAMVSGEAEEVLETLKKIWEQGITIVWIEHLLMMMSEGVDRLLVISQGSWLHCGDPKEVMKSEEVLECYLGAEED